MPLAKSAESPVEKEPIASPPPSPGLSGFEWQGIPIDVLRHFNAELGTIPTKDLEMLKDITEWAKSINPEESSIGNILQHISKIERQLGAPRINEKGYAKVHQFVKMQRVIDEMTKRQNSMKQGNWIG